MAQAVEVERLLKSEFETWLRWGDRWFYFGRLLKCNFQEKPLRYCNE
jgi:hypothetical protein